MNLQNLTYTINNLSPRQKMVALAAIVGASAVISTIALSQRQSSRTTVNKLPDSSLPSPLAPITTIPNTTGNLDSSLTPGIINPSGTTTSRFNSGTTNSPGNNLNPGSNSAALDRSLSSGSGRATNSNLNSISPSITIAPNPNFTTAVPRRVFVPNPPSANMAPASPIIPTTSPTQDSTLPSASTSPVNSAIPPEGYSATSPIDSQIPTIENSPTFDSRTGTYTTSPRPTSNNLRESLGSPNSVNSPVNNSGNTPDFYSNPNFSRPNAGSSNTNSNNPVYGSSNGTTSSNPIYSNPNGNINSNSIYGSPNGSNSNTSPNGTITP